MVDGEVPVLTKRQEVGRDLDEQAENRYEDEDSHEQNAQKSCKRNNEQKQAKKKGKVETVALNVMRSDSHERNRQALDMKNK